MKPPAFIVFLLILLSCQSQPAKLFWLAEPKGHRNDLLEMAESTNCVPIVPDSLRFFQTEEEIFSAEKQVFKHFGTLHKNERFSLQVILREGSRPGRDYTFFLRTFDPTKKLIASLPLGVWQEAVGNYCTGYVDERLHIYKHCDEKGSMEFSIQEDGQFIEHALTQK
ncbi:MAG: hypothetical protein AAFR61_07555 [Bacteroidota bacterium]